MLRHAKVMLPDTDLDQLHAIKRQLQRELGRRVTVEDLLREGASMVIRYYGSVGMADGDAQQP
jgi:hypothetical protein